MCSKRSKAKYTKHLSRSSPSCYRTTLLLCLANFSFQAEAKGGCRGRYRRPWEVFAWDSFFPLTHGGASSLAWPLPHVAILFVAPSLDNVLRRPLNTKVGRGRGRELSFLLVTCGTEPASCLARTPSILWGAPCQMKMRAPCLKNYEEFPDGNSRALNQAVQG